MSPFFLLQQREIAHGIEPHPLLVPDALVNGVQPVSVDDSHVVAGCDQLLRVVREHYGHRIVVAGEAHQRHRIGLGEQKRRDLRRQQRAPALTSCRKLQTLGGRIVGLVSSGKCWLDN